MFGVLSGVLLIVIIVLACCCQCKDQSGDFDLSNEYPDEDMVEMRKTRMLDSASLESDSGIGEPPMPRPQVTIDQNLVKAAAVGGVANTAFTKSEEESKVEEKAAAPSPVPEPEPEPEVTLVPKSVKIAPLAAAAVVATAKTEPPVLDPSTINDK